MSGIWLDVKSAARALSARPAFFAGAVLTLTLGVGGVASTFTLINASLMRPLPFRNAARTVWLYDTNPRRPLNDRGVSDAELHAWSLGLRALTSAIAFGDQPQVVDFLPAPSQLRSAVWSGASKNFFSITGARAGRGRLFGVGDSPDSTVVSYRFWRDYLSRANIPGAQLRMSNFSPSRLEVIGVLPPDFVFGTPAVDIWTLTSPAPPGTETWHDRWAIAVLRPGATPVRLAAAFSGVRATLAAAYPTERYWRTRAETLRAHLTGNLRPLLGSLLAASALLLLIVCANLASFFLARAADRQRQLAIRVALGANTARLARQTFIECALVAAPGALAGLGLGAAILKLVRHLASLPSAAVLALVKPDPIAPPVLLVVLGCFLAATLVSGLAPAATTLATAKTGWLATASGNDRPHRGHSLFLVAEIALALALLIPAGLIFKSLVKLTEVPLGFSPRGLLAAEIQAPVPVPTSSVQAHAEWAAVGAALQDAAERAGRTPGVLSAAVASDAPLDLLGGARRRGVTLQIVSTNYFRTAGIKLIGGRGFDGADTWETPMRVILSSSAAQRFFPGQDPLGRKLDWFRCHLTRPADPQCVVIGVVQDTRQADIRRPEPVVYETLAQDPVNIANLIVRISPRRGAAREVAPRIRAVLDTLPGVNGGRLAVGRLVSIAARVRRALEVDRFRTSLFSLAGALGLALAVLGIFGLTAYIVALSRRELGIRAALGADPRRLLAETMAPVCRWLVCGCAIGLALSALTVGLLRPLLFGVAVSDPAVWALAVGVLCAAALLAAFLAARRAAGIDAAEALRQE